MLVRLFSFTIETKSKVKTKIIAADFGSADIYDNIRRELAGLDIGVLGENLLCCVDNNHCIRGNIHQHCLQDVFKATQTL